MQCKVCGRRLRMAAAIAAGMGSTCARKYHEAVKLRDQVVGAPGARLLFPETDRPLVEAATKEVEIVSQRTKPDAGTKPSASGGDAGGGRRRANAKKVVR